ncbi:MAG: DUF664 domain-containing protein [Deltaproteobacteria bacterium]|nr:DUF664 domain-containing protein [Deltaproteobacteria bacterium]
MEGSAIVLDAFGRVRDTLQSALADLTAEELIREPHPPIGWLAWRLTRVQDSQLSRLAGIEEAWIADSWHERFNMPLNATDYGPGLTHTREQVAAFRAPDAQTLLDYYDTVYVRSKTYLATVTPQELDRELNEPRYQPLPTVAVRLVSIITSDTQICGQILYFRSLHRHGGWYPREG